MIHFRYLPLVVLLALLALPGCLDVDNIYTVNPDGSGRVDVSMTFDLSGLPPESIPEGESVREFARSLINNSTGIEVWSDLKSVRTDAGIIRVSGRGYFRDLSAVSLDGAYPIGFRLDGNQSARRLVSFDIQSDVTAIEVERPAHIGAGEEPVGDDSTVVSRRPTRRAVGDEPMPPIGDDSTFLVRRDPLPAVGDDSTEYVARETVRRAEGDEDTAGSSDADLAPGGPSETIDIVASQLEELRLLGPEKLAGLRQRVTFLLPGTIDVVNNGFTRDSASRAVLVISGSRMLEVVDSVRGDEAFRREYQFAKNFPWSRLLFGEKMPGVAFGATAKPLFDYEREVADAKKRYPQLKRELGIR